MMVVPVLITSCHVSLNPKNGPVTAQTTIVASARINARGRPVARDAALAKRLNAEVFFIGSSDSRFVTELRCRFKGRRENCEKRRSRQSGCVRTSNMNADHSRRAFFKVAAATGAALVTTSPTRAQTGQA